MARSARPAGRGSRPAADLQHDDDRRRAGRPAPAAGGEAAARSARPPAEDLAQPPTCSRIAIGADLVGQHQPPAARPPRAAPSPPAEDLARPSTSSMIAIGDELAAQRQPQAARPRRAAPGPPGRGSGPAADLQHDHDRRRPGRPAPAAGGAAAARSARTAGRGSRPAADLQQDHDRRRAGRPASATGGAAAARSASPPAEDFTQPLTCSMITIGADPVARHQPPAARPPRAAPGPRAEDLARPPTSSMIRIGDQLAAQHPPPAARPRRAAPGPAGRGSRPAATSSMITIGDELAVRSQSQESAFYWLFMSKSWSVATARRGRKKVARRFRRARSRIVGLLDREAYQGDVSPIRQGESRSCTGGELDRYGAADPCD